MSDKAKGVLTYVFGWIGGLIFLLMKDSNETVKFHAAQAIVASGGYFIISMLYSFIPITIPFFGTLLWALYLVIVIFGIVKVCQESNPEIPLIGKAAEAIFGKVIHK